MNKNQKLANDIYKIIEKYKIITYTHCMTRLRVTLENYSSKIEEELKELEGVLGVVNSSDQLQIIIGPNVSNVASEFDKLVSNNNNTNQVVKTKEKYKKNSSVQNFLAKFSKIFVPLIPGFIAAGLLSGISSLIMTTLKPVEHTWIFDLAKYLGSFQTIMSVIMIILIGHNTTKEFGGSGVNGAIISGFYLLTFNKPIIGKMPLGITEFFSMKLALSGGILHGSIIGVLTSGIFVAFFEKQLRKIIHPNLDLILTSAITLIISGIFTILVIGQVSGYLFDLVSWLFVHLSENAFGAALLSGLFLITVVFGVHQGFIPVYTSLVAKLGMNTLFPILSMAGAGQVGGAFALYLKEKNTQNKRVILSAIVPGILGIGEPLIYGVTLPRVKPFITSCIGGAVGGLFIGLNSMFGIKIGLNTVFGPSGIVALPLMKSNHGIITGMSIYLLGILISYVSGFIITYFFGMQKGSKNEN